MEPGGKAEQNLALKVMRLTRPCLALNTSTTRFAGEDSSSTGDGTLQEVLDGLGNSPAYSSSLVLPQSFG